jgi:hypothetical protein
MSNILCTGKLNIKFKMTIIFNMIRITYHCLILYSISPLIVLPAFVHYRFVICIIVKIWSVGHYADEGWFLSIPVPLRQWYILPSTGSIPLPLVQTYCMSYSTLFRYKRCSIWNFERDVQWLYFGTGGDFSQNVRNLNHFTVYA